MTLWALPCENLRFSAICGGTDEPVLVLGTLIQLGDNNIQRNKPDACTTFELLDTIIIRASVYRDEFGTGWTELLESPVRTLIRSVPLFQLCAEPSCNVTCPKFHPAVEESVTQVLLGVWSRQFQKIDGDNSPPCKCHHSDAQIFRYWRHLSQASEPRWPPH